MLSKTQRPKIEKWCNQVPVLGFNSGRYDLNLIREHFAERLSDTTGKVRVAKNGNKIMFILSKNFRFLDIINYLGPGTSYEKWVKAYECETVKSWFPYEWFDTPEKLDFRGLPKYEDWYSKLKGGYVLTRDEWEGCQRLFKEKRMCTFADWLRYYNNLDVAPGLEALEKMRAFYTDKGIDILKDAVSIPGVSLHYLLRGCVERGADLYSPCKEAYEMLKEAVVGGPSLVFTRYHEVGVTKIRSHRIAEPRFCKNILGYDANALYLSTMLRDMPCGKGRACRACWWLIYFQNFTRFWIVFNLLFKRIVWPCVIMSRQCPTFFWFRKFTNCCTYIKPSFIQIRSVSFVTLVWSNFS